ncbi:MAG TPA: c-type cytochrome [Acidobacteriaceae bacterium]
MRGFVLGFVVAIIVVAVAVYSYVRFGWIDPRADIPVGMLESKIAMPSLDAAVDRRAPDVKNPVAATDDNLIAGMKSYQTNCSGCHGDIHHPHSVLADALYPRAPQFVEDPPDMPENQNFYIIQHGVRLSGMPAWKQAMSEQEIWQVTTFLSHMDKLPPGVRDAWKSVAGGASPEGNSQSQHMEKGMDMQ